MKQDTNNDTVIRLWMGRHAVDTIVEAVQNGAITENDAQAICLTWYCARYRTPYKDMTVSPHFKSYVARIRKLIRETPAKQEQTNVISLFPAD